MSRSVKGAALTLLGGMCWGVSGSMGQYLFTTQGMDSRWLVPIRLFLAGVILFAYCVIRYGKQTFRPWARRKTAVLLLLYGIPGVAFCQFTYFLCIQLSSAGIGTILQDLSPITILIVSCVLAGRKPRGYEAISILLALCGVFCLVTHGNMTHLSVSLPALLAGIASALCVTVYNMLSGPLLKDYPVSILQCWSFLLGGIVLAVIFRSWEIHYVPNAVGYLGIAFVVIVGNVMAFGSYIAGVGMIGPEKGILYGFSEPVTAAVVTAVFMGSPFTGWDLAGFVLVFSMIALISVSGRENSGTS